VSQPKEADLEALLQSLVDAGIEFIVVGGAAAVLHGAPTTTQDLDIVHRRTAANVDRLLALLNRLDTVVREPQNRRLRITADALIGSGQHNLATDLGPLDPLGSLHDGRGYDDLLSHSVLMEDGQLRIRVIDLDTLISIKASTHRNKDKLLLPILIALRNEIESSE
jgi:predicted nucleotidyltransferase